MYNHFQNALQMQANTFATGLVERDFSVDRYTVGFEKTFFEGCWSAELRMPFVGRTTFDTGDFYGAGGTVGNLALILKRVIYESDDTVAAVGLGIDVPTGADAVGRMFTSEMRFRNQSAHLLPYVGILRTAREPFFWQSFLQIDVPLNGNFVDVSDPAYGSRDIGRLYDQTLLYFDLELGYWLHRNPGANFVTGLAAVIEFHYTSTLNDADILTGTDPFGTVYTLGNGVNRVDPMNLTLGLHAELNNHTLCRVAAVVPLRTGDDRLFDAEVQVQLERRF